jgi:hypothetical protein
MSKAAAENATEETTAVGNALGWYYRAVQFVQGEGVAGNGRWLSDLERQEAGYPWSSRREVVPPGDDGKLSWAAVEKACSLSLAVELPPRNGCGATRVQSISHT